MSRLRLSSLLAVATVVVATGCAEGNREHGTLEITTPASGARFDLTSDVVDGKPGVQVAARVQATGLDGRSVSLRATQGTVTAPAVTVADGVADFELTIAGSATIEAYATAEDGTEVKSVPVSFTYDPASVLCRILLPVDGATLGAGDDRSELPGFQADVEVRCLGVEFGNPVTLSVGGNAAASIGLGSGGRVTFPAVELAEGSNAIEVHTRTNAGLEATATAAVTVDTGSCRLVVTPANGTVFNARGEGEHAHVVADTTLGAPMTAVLAVESTCTTGTIEIRRGDEVVSTAPAAAGTVTIPVELADGIAELRAYAVDGSTGTSPLVRYVVDAVVPTGGFTAPAANAQLVDADDTSADPGLQVEVRGAFEGIDPGTGVDVVVQTGDARSETRTTVLQGGAFRTTLTLANGSHQVTATATRPSGTTATATLNVRSNFLAATLAIASPTQGESFPLARDASPNAGYQLKVGLAGTNLSGATGSINCGGVTAPFTLANNGTAQATLTLDVTECQGRTVTCTATANRNGSTFTSAEVAVTVDPTPPVVTLVAPADGAVLQSETLALEATTDCAGERQTAAVERGATVLYGPARVAANAVDADVTLPFGESVLGLKVTDAAGNETTVPFTVFVDGAAPVVTFVAPAPAEPALLTAAADTDSDLANGLQTDVVVEVPNEAVGTAVTLRIDERSPVVARTALDANRRRLAVFEDVTLPEGDLSLEACASDDAHATTCATLSVRVSTGRPVCTLDTPGDGAALAASDDESADPGLQTELSVTTNVEDGRTVTVVLAGPNGETATVEGTVQDGAALLAATFAAEGSWRATATCTNAAGATARSLENAVLVDYTVPVASIVEPADGATLNLATADKSAAAGFQIDLEAATEAAETGALAFVTVSCGAGPVALEPVALEGSTVTVPALSLPEEGSCDLTLVVEDAAGNESAPVTHRVIIDRVAPVIVVDAPVNGALLGKSRDANLSTAAFELDRVGVRVTGSNANPKLAVGGTEISGGAFAGAPPAQVSGDWTFVTLAEGANDLVVTATDASGNTATTTVTVTVDTIAPNIAIVGLSNNMALRARSDIDPATPGLQLNVQLSGERLDNGTTVRACSSQAPAAAAACATGTGRVLASSVLSGGAAVIPNVTLPEGTVELYAEAQSLSGNTARSTALTVRVDTVAPVVRELKLTRRTGETLADQASGSVTLGPAADADAATPGLQARLTARVEGVEPGYGLSARFFTSNPVPNTPVGSSVLVAADGTVTLDVTFPEGGHRVHVVTADLFGNPNSTPDQPLPGDAPVVVNAAVHLVAPTLALVAPRPGRLLVAHDRDTATAGLQYEVRVDSDAGAGRTVELLLDGTAFDTVELPLTGTTGAKVVTLPEGTHTLAARVQDGEGNVTSTAAVSVLVDSVGPTIVISQPQEGATIATDADPAADGFQISVQLTYGSVEEGRPVVLLSSTGGQLASGVTSAAGTIVFPPLTVQPGAQTLTARTSDANGNTTTSTPVAVTIDTNAPSVAFAAAGNPLWFGTDDGVSGGSCSVTLAARSNTEGATVALLVNGSAGPTATVTGGVATFTNVVIAPGGPVTLQLRATDAESRTGYSAPREARCDLAAPTVAFADPSGAAVVSYVAFGNPGGVAGARTDKLPTTALEADITVNTGGAARGVVVLTGSVDGELARDELAADTETVVFTSVAIPSAGAQTLTARVEDEAGNSATATLSIDADVVAPGAANAAADVLDGRAGRVKLVFPAPGGDGATGAPVTAYVVKVAEAAITTPETWTAARTLAPEAFTVAAPGAVQELVVGGLALEKQWFFAVRALDAKGNLGPLGTTPEADLRLDRTRATLWPSAAAHAISVNTRLVVADLDDDGFDDLVVSNVLQDTKGVVTVVYGGPTPSAPVTLSPATTSRFGSALAAGDLTGDGIPELVIGAQFESSGLTATAGARDGVAYVLVGQANTRLTNASLASATRILGQVHANDVANAATVVFGFGFSAEVVSDLTGDGLDDLVVGNPGDNGRKGRLFVFAGRTSWPASLVAETAAVATVTSAFTATNGPWFAHQLASLGDLNADGFGDLAVAAPGGTLATDVARPVYVLSGKLLAGAVIADAVGTAVYPTAQATAYPKASFFGQGLSAADVTGDGKHDLAVLDTASTLLKLFVYDGAALTLPTVAGGTLTDSSASRLLGAALPVGEGTGTPSVSAWQDVTGDGRDEFAVAHAGSNAGNVVWSWFGRPAAQWSEAGAVNPSLRIAGEASVAGSFGARTASGHVVTTDGARDIVSVSLSGHVTVLSGP